MVEGWVVVCADGAIHEDYDTPGIHHDLEGGLPHEDAEWMARATLKSLDVDPKTDDCGKPITCGPHRVAKLIEQA